MQTKTRLIVEGKLTQLGNELIRVQAVLSGSKDSILYLVDEGALSRV